MVHALCNIFGRQFEANGGPCNGRIVDDSRQKPMFCGYRPYYLWISRLGTWCVVPDGFPHPGDESWHTGVESGAIGGAATVSRAHNANKMPEVVHGTSASQRATAIALYAENQLYTYEYNDLYQTKTWGENIYFPTIVCARFMNSEKTLYMIIKQQTPVNKNGKGIT